MYHAATLVPPASSSATPNASTAATGQAALARGAGLTITTGASAGPSRSMMATASARLAAPSLASALPTCQLTVLSAIDNVAAISFVVIPAATSRRIWLSRMLRFVSTRVSTQWFCQTTVACELVT